MSVEPSSLDAWLQKLTRTRFAEEENIFLGNHGSKARQAIDSGIIPTSSRMVFVTLL